MKKKKKIDENVVIIEEKNKKTNKKSVIIKDKITDEELREQERLKKIKIKEKKIKKKKQYIEKKKLEKKEKLKIEKKVRETKREKDIKIQQENIIKNHDIIWKPPTDIELKDMDTNSWFDLKKHTSNTEQPYKVKKYNTEFSEALDKSFKVELKLNIKQKIIIDNWFEAYTKMYNTTLSYIKNVYKTTGKVNINFRNLRTNYLKEEKAEIIKNSTPFEDRRIYVNMIDGAIKLVCSNYKSALTNLKAGNIKHFRIRYWKYNKKNMILNVEQNFFKKFYGYIDENGEQVIKINNKLTQKEIKNGYKLKYLYTTFCNQIIGEIEASYNNKKFDFKDILNKHQRDCKLWYNYKESKYYLLVSTKIETEKVDKKKNIVSIDPGVRTYLNCMSEDEVIKIGDNMYDKIKELHDKKDKYKDLFKNKYINKKILKRNCKRLNNKIYNLIEDLHWKSINYLTNKYETVVIGSMNVKSIVSNKTSNLKRIVKRILLSSRFYQFKQRLEYKCKQRHCNFEVINEWFTSKMCSCCGEIKENLGGSKVYKCDKCFSIMDRDINGARNIYIKSY